MPASHWDESSQLSQKPWSLQTLPPSQVQLLSQESGHNIFVHIQRPSELQPQVLQPSSANLVSPGVHSQSAVLQVSSEP